MRTIRTASRWHTSLVSWPGSGFGGEGSRQRHHRQTERADSPRWGLGAERVPPTCLGQSANLLASPHLSCCARRLPISNSVGERIIETIGSLAVLALSLGILGGTLWFLGFFGMLSGYSGPLNNEIDDNTPPQWEEVVVEDQPELPAPEPVYWTCYWDPTMNENWHDDVACSRGSETTRPILLPDWPFVTYDDMMRAAREYEADLNG